MEEKILKRMTEYFGEDKKRIYHAREVLRYAKELLKNEGGSNAVVISVAILHDIGIKECEMKYNSTNGQLQEKEGPPIAREILESLKIREEIIDEVCRIIASHHSPGEVNTLNFKILWDADWLVNLKDEYDIRNKKKLGMIIEKVFMTKTGKTKARKFYLNHGEG